MKRTNMWRNGILATLLVISMFLSFGTVNATWFNDSFDYRAEINISNEGTSTFTNFPALLNITYRTAMQTDYEDLRFTSGSCIDGGTELDYEIDNYSASAALVWLSIPSLPPAGASVCMYYGNSTVSSGQNASEVWTDYEGVWHFSDYGSTTDRNGSTGVNNAAPQNYDGDEEVPGILGRADEFDGSNDYLAIRDKSYNAQNLDEVSMCVWFRTNYSGTGYNNNWAFLDFDRSEFFDFYVRADDGRLAFSTDSGGIDDFDGTTTGLNDNNWHYGCAVYDGSDKIIYLNGVEDNRRVNAHSGANLGGTTARFGLIGDGSEAGSFNSGQNNIFYDGIIDDIQYGEFTKTEDWINQSYRMVVNQSSYVSLGIEQENWGVINITNIEPSLLATNFVAQNQTFEFNATIICEGTSKAKCGNLTISSQYNNTASTFADIATSSTTPMWTSSTQPQYCYLNGTQNCTLTWTVNMTADRGTEHLQRIFATSNYTNVSNSTSANLTTEIPTGNVVAFNQSIASFATLTKNTGNGVLPINITSTIGSNSNIAVTCESGDCGVITEGFVDGLDLNETNTSTFNFFCSTSNVGLYSALYNVSSDEYTLGNTVNVSCQVDPVFGPMSVQVNSPNTSNIHQVAQNRTIIINASISCNGTCGNVTASLIYNQSNTEFGDGSDGSLTVTSADTIVNNYTYLTANELAGQTVLSVADTSEFTTNDQILIIQIQNGSGSGTAGQYEFATVSSVGASDITITTGLEGNYYSGTFNSTTSSVTQIVRVPQYTSVTVNSGASIVPSAWNGSQGGIVAFRVQETLNTTGYINASETGYRGGGCNGCGDSAAGDSGESYTGIGSASTNRNGIGGGGGYGPTGFNGDPGGGGGHATSGGIGDSNEGNDAQEGQTVGEVNLTRMFFGGGAGGGGDNDNRNPIPEFEDGGGIVFVTARTMPNARIVSNGETGVSEATGGAGTSGSGAGGTVWLITENVTLTDVTASGGSSVSGTAGDVGGAGGDGRVRVDYILLSGTTTPTIGYNETTDNGIYEVPTIMDTTVAWSQSANPQSCIVPEDGLCSFNWTLNATGDIGSLFNVSVYFQSNYSQIEDNFTENITLNITDNVVPTIQLYTPGNDTKIISNKTIEFRWYVTDDDPTLNCNFYLNSVFNQTVNCSSFANTTLNLTLDIGNYTWFVNVNDTLNNTINSSPNNFTLINGKNISVSKTIESQNTNYNMYLVTFNVTNLLKFSVDITLYDYVDTPEFTFGSFNYLYNFTNSSDGGRFNGTMLGWNLTLAANEQRVINYSIASTNSTDYNLKENWLFAIE